MPDMTITPNLDAIKAAHDALAEFPGKFQAAGRDALNASMARGKTVAGTDLAKQMMATKGSVSKRLNILKATRSNLLVQMMIRGGRGVNLAGFGARQNSSGVTTKINTVLHGFITHGVRKPKTSFTFEEPVGNKIVALRAGAKRVMKMGRYAGATIKRGPRAGQPILRQPIVAQYGPTVAEEWEKNPQIEQHTTTAFDEAVPVKLDQQIKRYTT